MPSCETVPPSLKAGQKDLARQGLYAEEAKPAQEPYLFEDQFNVSAYKKDLATTLSEDYTFKTSPHKPPEVTCEGVEGGTHHWQSEYKSSINSTGLDEVEFGRPWFPVDDTSNHQSMLTRGVGDSTYANEFGKHGSNPRDKILKMQGLHGLTWKKDLDAGTMKGTYHIPGYQGFIPSNTCLAETARVEKGENTRSIDKTNIDQTFHVNLIGYAGHAPRSARNDRGGRQPSILTISGHDFQDPKHYD
jgi:hypothetical protein